MGFIQITYFKGHGSWRESQANDKLLLKAMSFSYHME